MRRKHYPDDLVIFQYFVQIPLCNAALDNLNSCIAHSAPNYLFTCMPRFWFLIGLVYLLERMCASNVVSVHMSVEAIDRVQFEFFQQLNGRKSVVTKRGRKEQNRRNIGSLFDKSENSYTGCNFVWFFETIDSFKLINIRLMHSCFPICAKQFNRT